MISPRRSQRSDQNLGGFSQTCKGERDISGCTHTGQGRYKTKKEKEKQRDEINKGVSAKVKGLTKRLTKRQTQKPKWKIM